MSDNSVKEERTIAREYSVPAIVAAVLGIGSLVVSSTPLLALLLAISAIVIALQARRQLKSNPQMRGFAASLVGFLAAVWVIVITGIPYLYTTILVATVVGFD